MGANHDEAGEQAERSVDVHPGAVGVRGRPSSQRAARRRVVKRTVLVFHDASIRRSVPCSYRNWPRFWLLANEAGQRPGSSGEAWPWPQHSPGSGYGRVSVPWDSSQAFARAGEARDSQAS